MTWPAQVGTELELPAIGGDAVENAAAALRWDVQLEMKLDLLCA